MPDFDFDFGFDFDADIDADIDADLDDGSDTSGGVASLLDVGGGSESKPRKKKVLTTFELVLLGVLLWGAFGVVAGVLLWILFQSLGPRSWQPWFWGSVILAFAWAFGNVFWQFFRRGRIRAWFAILFALAFHVAALKGILKSVIV